MHELQLDRRSGSERRHATVGAYWRGAMQPRRRNGRRESDQYPIIDWHSPRVLAVVVTILGLCVLDGVLTVMLMSHGATEMNPVMAMFLPHDLGMFAAVKLSLTSVGMFVLVACSRMRVFSAIPGEAFLYIVLAGYIALIGYELELFKLLPSAD
ncbi:MAG: DUF5658 family protein [Steroidobacter sp.]